MRLELENLCFAYTDKNVIEDISLRVNKGEFVGLIGPNGSGKSTVLKNLYKALTPDKGSAFLDGEDLYRMSHKKAAQKIGVVGQENYVPFDFKVEEIVSMGRSPLKRLFEPDTQEDKKMVLHALEHLGMEDMVSRSYLNLSGGEKQRVLIARVIAQETDFLILDEPTNHLDIGYQMEIFDFIKRLKVTVLSAIHDLNMAALYCDVIYALKDGKVYKMGTPEEVLTPENIYELYGVWADTTVHPVTKKLSITYLPEGAMQNLCNQ